jgi:hypothetical protein
MTNSDARLERRYRRLLGLYPRSYREQHGEDMIGVLMTDSDEGSSRSRLASVLDLVRHPLVVIHLILAGRTAAKYRTRS